IRHLSDLRVPQRIAVRRVESDEVAGYVAAEQQLPRRGEQPGRAAAAGCAELVAPGRLPRRGINRDQVGAERSDADFFLAAEAHRAARIGLAQVVHREAL